MPLQWRHVSSSTVRQSLAVGTLPELEFGLLKRYGTKLHWKSEEKAVVLDMAIDTLEATMEHMSFEVTVRSLCHSRGVTADYLQFRERFNMKQCVLLLGDVGEVHQSWAELLQPAVHFFVHEFNALFIEIPAFASNAVRWLQHGHSLLVGALKYMCVEKVSVVARGMGGSIFLQTLLQSPASFASTHLIYNLDLPSGSKKVPWNQSELEELLVLSETDLQLWFAFNDDGPLEEEAGGRGPRHYGRAGWGGASKCYDAISKLSARVEGAMTKQRRQCFDPVLISERVNLNHVENVKNIYIKPPPYVLFCFSSTFLSCLTRFLKFKPDATKEDFDGGLLVKKDMQRMIEEVSIGHEYELPAIRRLRASPTKEERARAAELNRRRLAKVEGSLLLSLLPPLPALSEALRDTDGRHSEHRDAMREYDALQDVPRPTSVGSSIGPSASASRAASRNGTLANSPSAPALLWTAGGVFDAESSQLLEARAGMTSRSGGGGGGVEYEDETEQYRREWNKLREEMMMPDW